ncbi:efflux RND transporter permease subunit [Fredinandcohnia sp. QZ13]|uniref:efflux RND transporter permease subunit n=1 Tax=Fredinandcohnia sp. QZ13 TaxID=3073144 RepID=UPI0028536C4B|nr:efflux RND transporter permease subunit [Fredinandcohnia sp. QZ13]MDR4888814.1 efflux RND transporter permease subunit [Fredinandcohnia sp. QZ13]
MNLLKFIVQRKILITLMIFLVTVLGGYSLLKVDKELMPPVKLDGAFVEIYAGEMAAIEVERTITTPIEQQILAIDGVEGVESTTNIGRTMLNLTFESGRGEEIFKEVESVIASAKSEYPNITDIASGQYGGSQSYEFFMDVSGGNMEEMSAFSKEILEPRLEALPEVRDVLLTGSKEQEVSIKIDREKLLKHNLEVSQVVAAIQQSEGEATLGELQNEKGSPSLRWSSKIDSINDIENISLLTQNGSILLKDVATITIQPIENNSYVWKNGSQDFILVQIGRVSNVTQIEMAKAIRAEVKKIQSEGLVKNFELNEVVAQADYVSESIDGVKDNILIGGIIAIVILLLFLRNIRATFIIGLSIPSSVLLTFTAMWLFDYSFNMLTLLGLGLGIGMMVDSSIVILEAIYKKKELGFGRFESVIEGTKEVASAVIASMLTTIVVFLPIGLIGGEMGEFVIMLSAVVAITLISSVIISFTLIPSLSEVFLKLRKPSKLKKDSIFMKGYRNVVAWVIKKKRNSLAIITLFLLMLVGSLFLVSKIPMTIMPDMLNRYAELGVDLEPGLSVEEKQNVVNEINQRLQKVNDVETNYVMDNGSMLYIIINMTKGDQITVEQKEVNEKILDTLRKMQEDQPVLGVQSAMAGGGGFPVKVNIKGDSFEQLQMISNKFADELQNVDGISAITNSVERSSDEQIVVLKEKEMEEEGLLPSQVKQFIETSFIQMSVGTMQYDNETIPLQLSWTKIPDTKTDLLDMKIPVNGVEVPLSTFIELETVQTPNEIIHSDGERLVTISADIKDRDLGAVNRDIQKMIDEFEMPTGYTLSAGGDLEQQQELMTDMIFVFAISIFLVYLVMAVQFNHFGHPLLVMSVIPITIIGVILGLFITQMELNLMSGMGIIMLVGIVLNNAILLIDRTNQLRKEGFTIEEALVGAGNDRIRPIFMTTLTTVGGMLPLALESGASGNYQAPMATVIISGLSFATLITLLLIPAVYRLFSFSRIPATRRERNKLKARATTKVETAPKI